MVVEASSFPDLHQEQMSSSNGQVYYGDDCGEEEVQSELMPYYHDEENEWDYYVEVNDDDYWDVYFEPTEQDTLNTSFSD
jgi:hypothetical protein